MALDSLNLTGVLKSNEFENWTHESMPVNPRADGYSEKNVFKSESAVVVGGQKCGDRIKMRRLMGLDADNCSCSCRHLCIYALQPLLVRYSNPITLP